MSWVRINQDKSLCTGTATDFIKQPEGSPKGAMVSGSLDICGAPEVVEEDCGWSADWGEGLDSAEVFVLEEVSSDGMW